MLQSSWRGTGVRTSGGLRLYQQEYHGEEPSEKAEQIRLARQRAAQYVLDYLSTHASVECGETAPVVLEFDHVRGKKSDDVSVLIAHGKPLDIIKNEIEKCEVRCGNCHRRKTARERGWLGRRSKG